MPRIDKILYATDLSKNSAYAFQYATDIADKHDALIYILNVVEELPETARITLENYLSDEQYQKFMNRKLDSVDIIRARLSAFCDNVQKGDPQCVFRVAAIDVLARRDFGYSNRVILIGWILFVMKENKFD